MFCVCVCEREGESVSVCGHESPTERGSSAVSSCQVLGLSLCLSLSLFAAPAVENLNPLLFLTLPSLFCPPTVAGWVWGRGGGAAPLAQACWPEIRKYGTQPTPPLPPPALPVWGLNMLQTHTYMHTHMQQTSSYFAAWWPDLVTALPSQHFKYFLPVHLFSCLLALGSAALSLSLSPREGCYPCYIRCSHAERHRTNRHSLQSMLLIQWEWKHFPECACQRFYRLVVWRGVKWTRDVRLEASVVPQPLASRCEMCREWAGGGCCWGGEQSGGGAWACDCRSALMGIPLALSWVRHTQITLQAWELREDSASEGNNY